MINSLKKWSLHQCSKRNELFIFSFFFQNPNHSFPLKFFQYVGWTETRVPNSCKAVINLLTKISHWQNTQQVRGPITIMCSDGIGRSGTLAAIMYVLERVLYDDVLDVFQAIKSMRIQRPHAVKYMVRTNIYWASIVIFFCIIFVNGNVPSIYSSIYCFISKLFCT